MSGGDWAVVAVIALCFAFSALLALAETAFTKMGRIRALALAEEGSRRAERLAHLLETPERTINAVLLAVLVCQFTAATLAGVLLERLGPVAIGLGTVGQVVVFFVFAEVMPKTFSIQHTDRAALMVTPLLGFLTRFGPLRVMSRGLIGMANVILPGKGLKQGPFVSEEEIRTMADVAAAEEAIEREERRLIHSIFEFGDTLVREVMRPRPDIVSVEVDHTIDEALDAAISAGYSRLPACEGGTDNIVGLVFLKDLARRSRAGHGADPVRTALRPAVFVPETKRVAELLREMQTRQFHMAIVVDEYGDTAGLVTLEDLLEEIVGEIADEYDVERPPLEHLPDGGLRVAGSLSINDLNEELGADLPHEEWDTVAGLVFTLLGHVPAEGEAVAFQGYELRTERVVGRRIASVLIHRVPTGAPAEEAATRAPVDSSP